MKKFYIVLFCLVFILVGIFSVKITDFNFGGNTRYTDEEMKEMLFPNELSKITLYNFIRSKFKKDYNIPFIQGVDIYVTGLNSADIIVYEKSVVGCVKYMSSYMYFDKDGIVVESSNNLLEGIPIIDGLDFGRVVLYEKLPISNEKVFEEMLNITQVLVGYGITVDKITISSDNNITLYIGKIEVYLGDSSELNGKIGELRDIWEKIKDLSGILYLDNYNPIKENTTYTFKKR